MKIDIFAAHTFCRRAILALAALVMIATAASAQVIDIEQKLAELDKIERNIDFIGRTIESADNDNALIGARSKLLDLQPEIDAVIEPVEARIATLTTQLEALGPAPAQGESESVQISGDRQDARALRQDLRIVTARAEELDQKINAAFEKIANLRRQIFTNRLSQRSPVTVELLTSIGGDSLKAISRFQSKLRTWWTAKVVPDPRPAALVFAFFVVLLLGAACLRDEPTAFCLPMRRVSMR